MEKHMGYQAIMPPQRPERLLPEINISGTLFHIDIAKLEFRQIDNPANRMPIMDAKEEMGFSSFYFDTLTKNVYGGDTKMPDGIPNHVRVVLLPPLKELDPVGLARQQGLPDDYYNNRRSIQQKPIVVSKQKEHAQQQPVPTKKQRGQRF